MASVYRGTDADRQGGAVGEMVESVAGRALASAGVVDTLRVEEPLPLP